jgi:hypothetical protein
MSQYRITPDQIHTLETSTEFADCFKYGNRAVIFLEAMDASLLDELVHPGSNERFTAYGGKPLEGKGVVFYNPKDKCLQAMEINGSTCIVIALNGDREIAKAQYEDIIGGIKAALPGGIHSAEQVKKAIEVASTIVPDVYDSNIKWYESNTKVIQEEGNFHFVECTGKKVRALYFPDQVSIDTGTTATPQEFPDGAFLVKDSDKLHGCAPDAFLDTYKYESDGELHPIDDAFIKAATSDELLGACRIPDDS